MRVANPFGPFQVPIKNQGIIAKLISHALKDQSTDIWGDGSVVRDFIYIDDVVDALQIAINDTSEHCVFNVGAGRGRSLLEVIAAIEICLKRKLRINWMPNRPLDVPVSVLAIDRAKETLGWAPKTTFESGLQTTIAWWRSMM